MRMMITRKTLKKHKFNVFYNGDNLPAPDFKLNSERN
jgi:hypothetical protein